MTKSVAEFGIHLLVCDTECMRRENLKSIALHKAVVVKLRENPEFVLQKANSNLLKTEKKVTGKSGASWIYDWKNALNGSVENLVKFMLDTSEYANSLRQVSPFAGVLSNKERMTAINSIKGAI
jgi:hypothetical protein